MLIIQYRGNHTEHFAKKVRNIATTQIVFTTRKKLQRCLPWLKSIFQELKINVVYKLKCSGCKSIYVGETVRHLNTKF